MMEQKPPTAATWRWLLAPAAAALLAAAYALAGFLLLPWMAARELPRIAEEALHHRARVGEIRFNPFTFRLDVRGFSLETLQGEKVLGFADASVDLEWHSLPRRAWILDEVRLVDPEVHVEIAKDGRLNLAALLPEKDARTAPPPRFAIGRFSVVNGTVAFTDHRHGYRDSAERISIELSALSNLDHEKGPHVLSGQTRGGATLQWKGEVSLAPLAATGALTVRNAALAELMPYVDAFASLRASAGHADFDLPYQFEIADGKPRVSLKNAKLEVHGLTLASGAGKALLTRFGPIALHGIDFDSASGHAGINRIHLGETSVLRSRDKLLLARTGTLAADGAKYSLDSGSGAVARIAVAAVTLAAAEEGKPAAQLRDLVLDDLAFDLAAQRVSVKGLRVADLALAAKRDVNGDIDVLRLLASREGEPARDPLPRKATEAGKAGKGSARAAEWQIAIAAVQLQNGSARYADATSKLPLALALDGLSGSFGVELRSGEEGARMRVDGGRFALAKLEAQAAAGSTGSAPSPTLRLGELALEGARFDSAANAFEAGALRLGSAGVASVLANDRLSLLDLVPAAGKAGAEKAFTATLGRLELASGSIELSDPARGLSVGLERIALRMKDISSDGSRPLEFRLNADARAGGRIDLRGKMEPAQGALEARIDASGVALAPVQAILDRHARLKVVSGEVSLAGTVRSGGKDAKLAYAGNASVANLALDDPAGVRVFGWKSLATDSLKATLSPNRIDIDELRWTAPAGRFAIAKDGTTNLSRALGKEGAAPAAQPAGAVTAPAAAAASDAKSAAAGDVAVSVRRVRIEQGMLDFSDENIGQGFLVRIIDLAGTANGLSSNPLARAQFALEGRVDEFGYARLSGSINPFAPRNRSTFRVQMRNVDMVKATPYAMRFAGYRIAAGRLGLDVNYRVRDNLIEGDNKITLEDFELGERVDSPDALKLPFELAVKLLRDDEGKISLEVPVRGNLDDPQFDIAPLVWKAVGHFLGNLISAPFRGLAHLFGGAGDEDLGAIAFDPGRAALLPPEKEKLARVTAALARHPELKLVVPAYYDAEADARAMKRMALNREINRRAGFETGEGEEAGQVNIEDQATRRGLRALFAERFTRAELDRLRKEAEAKSLAAGEAAPSLTTRLRNLAGGEPQLVDTREFHRTLLRRLRDTQPLEPSALTELAQKRALAIEAALKAAGVAASRLARAVVEPGSDAEAKQITSRLTLSH